MSAAAHLLRFGRGRRSSPGAAVADGPNGRAEDVLLRKRAWRGPASLALGLAGTLALVSGASADCLRRIYNRSTYVLVARQDGGPPATLLPGQSLPVRLARPGRFELSAYCGIPDPGAAAAPVSRASFDYEAVLDRCFVRFGSDLFVPQLGRGFFGGQETAPFTVNDPRPGDVILGPSAGPACAVPSPALSRRG